MQIESKSAVKQCYQVSQLNYVQVVLLSDWFSNPYKELLIENIEAQGGQVKEFLAHFFSTTSNCRRYP